MEYLLGLVDLRNYHARKRHMVMLLNDVTEFITPRTQAVHQPHS